MNIGIENALLNINAMQPRFDRGYTGHEHMSGFGLINMNGRLYDPYLQRFLSPDPYVQAPVNAQNFNRYSYVLNNPFMYTDPSGEFIHIVVGAFFGGVLNVIFNKDKIRDFGDFFSYFGIGALAGAAGGFAGQAVAGALGAATSFGGAFANGAHVGAAGGFSGGFVGGAGNAWIGGAGFRQGLLAGFIGGGYGALGGALIGSSPCVSICSISRSVASNINRRF